MNLPEAKCDSCLGSRYSASPPMQAVALTGSPNAAKIAYDTGHIGIYSQLRYAPSMEQGRRDR